MNKFFSPHLSLAHSYWQNHVQPTDFAIDMTCGNGHDMAFLCRLLTKGLVYGLDIQTVALEKTKELLSCQGIHEQTYRLLLQSHATSIEVPRIPQLIVYNLGYLPRGLKSIVTTGENTLISLEQSIRLLGCDGALSITCYPGHEEGLREEAQVLRWAEQLSSSTWHVCHHRWINRKQAPSLVWITSKKELQMFRD